MRRLVSSLVLPVLLAASTLAAPLLGKLGQATAKIAIYAAPTTRAQVFYRAKAYDYVIVRQKATKVGWTRIVMATGIDGYAKSDKVAVLPYDIVAKTAAVSTPRGSRGSSAPASRGGMGYTVVSNAMNYRGTPYVWGGNDLNNGIDCSGFVQKLYGGVGVNLPRTAAEQALVGQPITRLEDLRAGDRLYFYERKRNKIGHTGIYMGNGYFVHSSRGHNGVATDYLGKPNWLRILVAARR